MILANVSYFLILYTSKNYQKKHTNLMDTRKKGYQGEDIAANYLKRKGYQIVRKNFHFGRYGEIDLIAKKKEVIVFIEVKLRHSNKFGDPAYSVGYTKQAHLRRAAEGYIYVNKIRDTEFRFDVITIEMEHGLAKINHIENAF